MAQRNAVRFAESNDTVTRSQLPADLLAQAEEVAAAQTALRNSGGRSERENLENAVSLVGTCEVRWRVFHFIKLHGNCMA